ncbi:MAG: hypothetical protein ACD_46C00256G0003, partial [uncultured bacterium]
MQVSVEKLSNIERRLTIIVPANQVEEAYAKHIDRFAKNANIKGFRPGKAPMSFIQQRFGDDARREALNEVIQQSLYTALTENKLNPISTPRVEPKSILADQPLEFTASFEVLPEIGSVVFKAEKIEKPVAEVSDEDVNVVVEQLKKQYTKWQVVERAANKDDRIVIDYHAIYEGKPDFDNKVQNFPLQLGSNIMIPGFEEGLLGVKIREEKTLNLTFPADFNNAEKAGKAVDFVVSVKQVFEADVPVIDADFVKKLGVKSGDEADLRKQINDSLKLECDRLIKEKVKEQVFRLLLEQNPIDVPNSLVSREAKNIHDEVYADHHQHNHNHSDDEMTAFNDVAKKRVALGLLIAEYAKQIQLKVDANRVQKRIEEIASVYESPQE